MKWLENVQSQESKNKETLHSFGLNVLVVLMWALALASCGL